MVDLIPKGLQARMIGVGLLPHLQPRPRRGAIAFRQVQFDLRTRKQRRRVISLSRMACPSA